MRSDFQKFSCKSTLSRDMFQKGSYLATFLLESRFVGLQNGNKQESGVRGQTGRTRGSRKCQ